jgi:hypothetical protein
MNGAAERLIVLPGPFFFRFARAQIAVVSTRSTKHARVDDQSTDMVLNESTAANVTIKLHITIHVFQFVRLIT